MSPFENDEDEFESSRFEAVLISPKGIFSSYRLRSVQQFVRFNAVGSGSSYALGALHALYDRLDTAREIAEKALEVAAEFDDSSGLPGTFHEKEASGRHICGDSKIISLRFGYLGFSGFAGMDLILQDYLKKNSVESLDSVDQIFGFVCDLRRQLQESYFLTREETGLLPFYQSGVEFLIVNQNGIFEVEYSGVVRCHLEFSAIGSGEEYALGTMAGVYNTSCDAEEIARVGVDAAAEFNRKTALPIDTFCVSPS